MAKIFKNSTPSLISGYGNREWYDVNGILQRDFHIGLDVVANNSDRFDYLVFPFDCSISWVEKRITGYQGGGSYGNNIVFYLGKIDGHTYEMRYAHLKYGSIPDSIYNGAKASALQVAGYMGATGNVNGAHVHAEVIIDGKTVDPYNYIFGNALDNLFKKISLPTPVVENKDVDQVKVICGDNTLFVRTGHSTKDTIIGYAKPGLYNIISTYEDGTYVWYQVEPNKWFANVKGCTEYIFKYIAPIVVEEPIAEQPIVTEPATPTENDDIKQIEQPKQEDNTNTNEIEKVPKSGFKLIIYTIIKNILDYLKERYNNDKKNFKGN